MAPLRPADLRLAADHLAEGTAAMLDLLLLGLGLGGFGLIAAYTFACDRV